MWVWHDHAGAWRRRADHIRHGDPQLHGRGNARGEERYDCDTSTAAPDTKDVDV